MQRVTDAYYNLGRRQREWLEIPGKTEPWGVVILNRRLWFCAELLLEAAVQIRIPRQILFYNLNPSE